MTRDYEGEVTRLAQQVDKVSRAAIEQGMPAYREDLTRLSNLYLIYRYVVERGIANEAPKGIRILYGKVCNSLVGILQLLDAGYPGPAAMVTRSLFETAVHLQVILKEDVQERAQLFDDFAIIEREASINNVPSVTEEQRLKHREEFARVRANYHPEKPFSWCWKVAPGSKKRNGVPNNPSFRDLCIHIGHAEYYDLIYGPLSAAIHPVPTYEGWLRRGDGQIELGPRFTSQTHTVADLVTALGMDSLVSVLRFLHPEDEVELGVFIIQKAGKPDRGDA